LTNFWTNISGNPKILGGGFQKKFLSRRFGPKWVKLVLLVQDGLLICPS